MITYTRASLRLALLQCSVGAIIIKYNIPPPNPILSIEAPTLPQPPILTIILFWGGSGYNYSIMGPKNPIPIIKAPTMYPNPPF